MKKRIKLMLAGVVMVLSIILLSYNIYSDLSSSKANIANLEIKNNLEDSDYKTDYEKSKTDKKEQKKGATIAKYVGLSGLAILAIATFVIVFSKEELVD